VILSDEKVYVWLKSRANRGGYVRMSRFEIAERTGLSMRTVAYSLKRLLAAERVFWNKPLKRQTDRFEIALYKIDPEISDC
jgi:hypothetical protein